MYQKITNVNNEVNANAQLVTTNHTFYHSFHQFRKRLHRGVDGGWAYYWTPNTGAYYTDKRTGKPAESKWSLWFPVDADVEPPKHWAGNNFFGVHPSAEPRQKWERSIIEGIAAINCVFAEVDGKDMVQPTEVNIAQSLAHLTAEDTERLARGDLTRMTPQLVLRRKAILHAKETIFKSNIDHYNRLAHTHVMHMEPKPSAIVASGGGYHLYWFLRDTFHLHTKEDRTRAKDIQAGWVEYVGGDDGAKDLARVLRPDGTENKKAKYAPDYPRVHFIHLDYTLEYTLEELEALIPAKPQPQAKTKQAKPEGATNAAGTINPKDAQPQRGSIPAIFNATYGIETLLAQYGYAQMGSRWTRPGGSDSPGVEIKNTGRAVIWSSNDPLWNEGYHAVSAFDAYMIWEHDGDFQAALYGAAQLLGLELTLSNVARPIIDRVQEWLISADLAPHVADDRKAQRRLEDGTTRAEYRSGHADKLTANLTLDIMRKAGRAQDVDTFYRQIVTTKNSDGVPVAVLHRDTAAAALTRLSFMFDVTPIARQKVIISLRKDFLADVVGIDLVRSATEYRSGESRYSVADLTQTTLDYTRVKSDDAFLTGAAWPVKQRMKRVAREFGDIEGVTYPELMKTVDPGLTTFAPACITALVEAGGSGCTYDDLRAASGGSLSQVRKIVRGLRAVGLESHRQYKEPSLHFLPADAFDRIKQELTHKLKTYGAGVHRLDKMLDHRQQWAKKEAKKYQAEGDIEMQQRAEMRVEKAAQQRLRIQPLLHPGCTEAQHLDQVYAEGYRPQPQQTKAPAMEAPGTLAWMRFHELAGNRPNGMSADEYGDFQQLTAILPSASELLAKFASSIGWNGVTA